MGSWEAVNHHPSPRTRLDPGPDSPRPAPVGPDCSHLTPGPGIPATPDHHILTPRPHQKIDYTMKLSRVKLLPHAADYCLWFLSTRGCCGLSKVCLNVVNQGRVCCIVVMVYFLNQALARRVCSYAPTTRSTACCTCK